MGDLVERDAVIKAIACHVSHYDDHYMHCLTRCIPEEIMKLPTFVTPSDEVAQRARVAGLEEAANRLKDYRLRCEQTGCELADKEDESSQRMYWRADGASDALETVEQEIRTLTATDVEQGTCTWPLGIDAEWYTECGFALDTVRRTKAMKFCAFCGKSLVEATKESEASNVR